MITIDAAPAKDSSSLFALDSVPKAGLRQSFCQLYRERDAELLLRNCAIDLGNREWLFSGSVSARESWVAAVRTPWLTARRTRISEHSIAYGMPLPIAE
jgi:hypothetical protein